MSVHSRHQYRCSAQHMEDSHWTPHDCHTPSCSCHCTSLYKCWSPWPVALATLCTIGGRPFNAKSSMWLLWLPSITQWYHSPSPSLPVTQPTPQQPVPWLASLHSLWENIQCRILCAALHLPQIHPSPTPITPPIATSLWLTPTALATLHSTNANDVGVSHGSSGTSLIQRHLMLPSGLLGQFDGLKMDLMWNLHMIRSSPSSRDVLIPMGRFILGQGTGHTTLHKLSCGSTFVQCVYLESLQRGSLSQVLSTNRHTCYSAPVQSTLLIFTTWCHSLQGCDDLLYAPLNSSVTRDLRGWGWRDSLNCWTISMSQTEDIRQGPGWAKLLLDTLQSSKGTQHLSHWYWELLVELAILESQRLRNVTLPTVPQTMKFLTEAQEWSKLECWMGTVWMVWPPGDGGITEEDLGCLMPVIPSTTWCSPEARAMDGAMEPKMG
jgi:hypothetical protein